MATWGVIVTQRADVQAVGQNELLPVQRVTVRTVPSGVVFDYLVPQASFDAAAIEVTVGAVAEAIESMIGLGDIVGAEYVEDLNASGALEFFLDVTVAVPPPNPQLQGPQTTQVRIPLYAFGESILRGPLINQPIAAAKATLGTWAGA